MNYELKFGQQRNRKKKSGHPQSRAASSVYSKKSITPSPAFAHDIGGSDLNGDDDGGRQTHSAQSTSRVGGSGNPVYLPDFFHLFNRRHPGDRVIFAESPSAPGIPIVYRTPEERSANPDRLNLDRRRLTVCPLLEGEEQLRLLNYQHNMITKIQHLGGLRRLIFLDLYDNQIEEISGLSALRSLRVLMLGKNRITRIHNLDQLTKLDVLDLHGNQICGIENLNHLTELRVLNLAGNLIDHVEGLMGMDALTELNLRRNRIRTVGDVDQLPNLQRLFLSFNEITSFEDISCLADSSSLSEISLDGNPISQEPQYKQMILRYMQQLKQLDMKRVSDDERRVAAVMARKEEEKKREGNKVAILKEKRRLAINNARRQWETMQGSLMSRTNSLVREAMPEIYAKHVGTVPSNGRLGDEETEGEESSRSSSRLSRPPSAKSVQSEREWGQNKQRPQSRQSTHTSRTVTPDKENRHHNHVSASRSSSTADMDHLMEIDGDTLNLYGQGSLEAFDKSWGIQAAGAVTTIVFKFIDFDDISRNLHKIRIRFPNVHTLQFNSTNIHSLSQLNALGGVRRLDHLVIETEGNSITNFTLWKVYLLFRLAHFSLKKINDTEIGATDIVNAEKFFGTLSHITTSQLPHTRLLSLLGDAKKRQLLNEDKKKAGDSKNTGESVGRAGLVYTSPDGQTQKQKDTQKRKEFVSSYVKSLSKDAVLSDQKQNALVKMWPKVLHEMVRSAVIDMLDMQSYSKRCLEEADKT